ncbi:MAG: hypothetical protein OEZ39_05465 [Gammaproteobacteria bacterium]|nr:hypothetical protein [Gammaproteobacteria bacterium]
MKEYEPDVDSEYLLKYSRTFVTPDYYPEQSTKSRIYIPWISPDGVLFGGGENPLLRGGIAMAGFAVEAMSKNDIGSLRYADLIFRYFESSEALLASGEKAGFFFRCDHFYMKSKTLEEIGGHNFHASTEEILGLVLGVYYFYIASKDGTQRARIRGLARRLGQNLKENGFLLIGPGVNPVIQKGFSGIYLYQWAVQQALQRITGERYEPTSNDYRDTSNRLWEIYLNAPERIYRTDKLELLGLMYIWSKNSYLDSSSAEKWENAFIENIASTIENADGAFNNWYFNFVAGDMGSALGSLASTILKEVNIDIGALKSSANRYVLTILVQSRVVYYWGTENWYNNTMALHTLHYALDDEVNKTNNTEDSAKRVAEAAFSLTKIILCGERQPIPQIWPPGYEVGTTDNDLYAAVIAKGLLQRFIPFDDIRCIITPIAPIGPLYIERINGALGARSRMWDNLPLGEPAEVRKGTWLAPVRWHNSKNLEEGKARVGLDFCWERGPGDIRRFLAKGSGVHSAASGMNEKLFKKTIASGIDVMLEAGGLDYFFPRALMSYWLNEPLEYSDAEVTPLRAASCFPIVHEGRYQKTKCKRNLAPTFMHMLLGE